MVGRFQTRQNVRLERRKERNDDQQETLAADVWFDASRVVIGRVRWSANQTDCHVSATYRYVDAANRNADRHTSATNAHTDKYPDINTHASPTNSYARTADAHASPTDTDPDAHCPNEHPSATNQDASTLRAHRDADG